MFIRRIGRAVTQVYREAVDAWKNGIVPEAGQLELWKKRLHEVFNRGFWHGGYYLGEKVGEWTASSENKATLVKVFAGLVLHYYPKSKVAEVRLTSEGVRVGDRFLVTGPTTGAVEGVITSLRTDDVPAESAGKGSEITFSFDSVVRKNDQFYLLVLRKEDD